ncbi:MAG: hypothetical protein IPK26_27375 [Planctomycetes bacterium]|nr:hypothetical protein [Planctomycetota bacterium]
MTTTTEPLALLDVRFAQDAAADQRALTAQQARYWALVESIAAGQPQTNVDSGVQIYPGGY